MKKLIFTLALTAGSISFISANTIDAEEKGNSNEIIKSNCYVQVIANIETPCGEYLYSSASPKYTVDCRSGQTEGTTTTYYETRIQGGWNHGSGPDQPTSCVN